MRRPTTVPALALIALGALGFVCPSTGPERVESPADLESGEVPFRLVGPGEAALVVPVELNGTGPYDFVLDTGATLTCVDDSLAEELDLPEREGVQGVGAGVGGSGRMRLVTLDSVRVGSAAAFDLMGCALNLESIRATGIEMRGLLGLNFLKSFHVVLDFERNVLTLSDPAAGTTSE